MSIIILVKFFRSKFEGVHFVQNYKQSPSNLHRTNSSSGTYKNITKVLTNIRHKISRFDIFTAATDNLYLTL